MQVIIDIPKEIYEMAKNGWTNTDYPYLRAIAHGFPLPTGGIALPKDGITNGDFKPITKNETPKQQIGKSCMNCKYHVTNCYQYPNFCYLIRKGLSCTDFSEWESNVVEELYSNEVNNND